MLDAVTCMNDLALRLRAAFGERLIYLGLQGSYARGEADEQSDLDVMCVLEGLTASDLDAYRQIILQLPWAEKACGFICGREELAAWNPLEIACLLRSTQDWVGSLKALVPESTREDLRRYVQLSAGNLYHELCHRRIYRGAARSVEALPRCGKTALYILQALALLETGSFPRTMAELTTLPNALDAQVAARVPELRRGDAPREQDFSLMLDWCRQVLGRAKNA